MIWSRFGRNSQQFGHRLQLDKFCQKRRYGGFNGVPKDPSKTLGPLGPPHRFGRRWKVLGPVAVVVTGGTVGLFADKYMFSSAAERSIRALYVMLGIAWDYSSYGGKFEDINELHTKCANRLIAMLLSNKGLYIKVGQAIANQGELMPRVYRDKFSQFYDDAPVEEWIHVDRVLRRNLGPNYELELFATIDHEPVASASIGQVHKGVLKLNGRPVALKVQHSYIPNQITADLFMYRLIAHIYEKLFDIPMTFFTRYVSEQMKTETDFVHELKNANKLSQFIAADKFNSINIYIPYNYGEFSTKQVLVTEWCDGVSLLNREKLVDHNFDLADIMRQYIGIFGQQIFRYGFIHSDPHPGNLLARYDNSGKQQLVLLDHGLYTTLPTKFKEEYCELWRALFTLDEARIKTIGCKWGIQSFDFFASLIKLSPVKAGALSPTTTDTDLVGLLRGFVRDEDKFPLELLFLTRTMRMMQTMNKSMGSPVNRINILTKYLLNGLCLNSRSQSFNGAVGAFVAWCQIKFMLFFSDLTFLFVRLRQLAFGDRFGEKKKGIEDYLEVYLQKTLEPLGMQLS